MHMMNTPVLTNAYGEYVSTPGKVLPYFPSIVPPSPPFLSPCWGPLRRQG